MNPQGGKVTPRTWGLIAAGSLCLLVSAIAFVVSVRTAAYNQGAQDYWTHVAHKPLASFRAHMLSSGFDWLAFGGFLSGLVTLTVGLARARKEKLDPSYKIGTAPDVRLAVEGAPSPSFPMVAPKGDDFVFNYGVGMTGDMVVDGKSVPLAELAASGHARPSTSAPGAFELPIPMNGKIRASIGQTSFQVSAVAKPVEQTSPLLAVQSKTLAYFAGSLGAHLGIVLLLSQIPVDDGTASSDLAALEPTDIRSSNPAKDDVPPTPPDEQPDLGGAGKEASGKNMALDEGTAGSLTAEQREQSKLRMMHRTDDDQISREEAVERARTYGFMGSTRWEDGSIFNSIIATGNVSSGPDDADVWGAIYGADGEGYGTFGYGRHGFGPGGGCGGEDCGIIGTPDGYGKIGLGKFGQSGWDGFGGGPHGLKKHIATHPEPVVGEAKVSGELDKAIIRRYIKRNIEKIAYCYDKELLAHPGIEGTVSIQFFISPTGSVTTSNGSGFNSDVSSCVAGVVGAIQFPRPDGGGGVPVNYPLTVPASG